MFIERHLTHAQCTTTADLLHSKPPRAPNSHVFLQRRRTHLGHTQRTTTFGPCPVHHDSRPSVVQGSTGPRQPCVFTASQNAFGTCQMHHDSRPTVAPCPVHHNSRPAVVQNSGSPTANAFSQPPKTHLGHAQRTTTADILQPRARRAPNSHMRFHSLPKRMWPAHHDSSPRPQGPQTARQAFAASRKNTWVAPCAACRGR